MFSCATSPPPPNQTKSSSSTLRGPWYVVHHCCDDTPRYDYKAAAGNTGASTGLTGGAAVDASAPPTMMPPTMLPPTAAAPANGQPVPAVAPAVSGGMMVPPTIPMVPASAATPVMFTPSAPVTADAPPPTTHNDSFPASHDLSEGAGATGAGGSAGDGGAGSAVAVAVAAQAPTANLAAPTGHQLAYQDLPANGFKRIDTPSLASAGDSAALVGVLTAVVARIDGSKTKKRVLDVGVPGFYF